MCSWCWNHTDRGYDMMLRELILSSWASEAHLFLMKKDRVFYKLLNMWVFVPPNMIFHHQLFENEIQGFPMIPVWISHPGCYESWDVPFQSVQMVHLKVQPPVGGQRGRQRESMLTLSYVHLWITCSYLLSLPLSCLFVPVNLEQGCQSPCTSHICGDILVMSLKYLWNQRCEI